MKFLNQKGFTLLETVMAIVILAIGVTGGLLMTSTAARNSANSGVRITATNLAEKFLDEIAIEKARANDGMAYLDGIADRAPVQLAQPYSSYTRQITVTQPDLTNDQIDNPDPNYRLVTVVISWGQVANGNGGNISVSAMYSQHNRN